MEEKDTFGYVAKYTDHLWKGPQEGTVTVASKKFSWGTREKTIIYSLLYTFCILYHGHIVFI